ncbi:PKD domain-containing protein [Micromonospora sp. WMMA1996]|uniref:PKD domain-containing protein n=1 Tax=Micromonospora sp. WMMA1996 TaxID=2039878 RepID=UPI00159BB0F2|nr:PKD domain-containing protein [Micromonospora sp. WMMA1996]
MRRPTLAGLAVAALAGGSLLTPAAPARAADATTLYVRQTSTACSDTGPGTSTQPFCSIGPAVARVEAGQTVDVGAGTYAERVTVSRSGTPDQPITIRNTASSNGRISGPTAGVLVDGQHDVVLRDLVMTKLADVPGVDLRDSTAVTVQGGSFTMTGPSATPVVRLAGVTRSTLDRVRVNGGTSVNGVALDASTTDVTVRAAVVISNAGDNGPERGVGIRVDGPGNEVSGALMGGFTGAAILLGPGAADTMVVNNQVSGGKGIGIHNNGAARTAITNNEVRDRCFESIRVDGSSDGASVQNNVVFSSGSQNEPYCDTTAERTAEIGLYDDSGRRVTVDYNNTVHGGLIPGSSNYSWNGTGMGLAGFRQVSGQAAHDKEGSTVADREDSANSAAPGYPATDRTGAGRADNPARPNTGAGPITYADRGPNELLGSPYATLDIRYDPDSSSATLDASASTPGYVPLTTYVFDFGDGTVVTQDKPVASHTYARTGTWTVSVKVSGNDGRVGASQDLLVSVLPRVGSIGLLSLYNLRFADAATVYSHVQADQATLGAGGQFDLMDAGDGRVALFSRATGKYLINGGDRIEPLYPAVSSNSTFDLLRNADGTVSLRSDGGGYVGVSSSTVLTTLASTITSREKFYRVNVADANRTLKAAVNGRYVSAESAGAKPLIANRTTAGPWETFDLADLGSGQVGVFAHANSRFVCADNVGLNPLIANRTSAGAWEKFTVTRNADGTTSLRATVNSRYVSADNVGTNPLIANRTTIGLWEKFTVGG